MDSCTKVLAQNRPPTDWLPDDTMGEPESFPKMSNSQEKTAEMKIQGVREKQPRLIRQAPPLIDYLEGPGRLYRIFESPFVSDATITRVVQQLNTRALMALESKFSSESGSSVRLASRVRRELKSRRTMKKNEYEHLTHEGLRAEKSRADTFVQELHKNKAMDELFSGSGSGDLWRRGGGM